MGKCVDFKQLRAHIGSRHDPTASFQLAKRKKSMMSSSVDTTLAPSASTGVASTGAASEQSSSVDVVLTIDASFVPT